VAAAVVGLGLPLGAAFGPVGVATAVGIAFALAGCGLFAYAGWRLGVPVAELVAVPGFALLCGAGTSILFAARVPLAEWDLLPRLGAKAALFALAYIAGHLAFGAPRSWQRLRTLLSLAR
jgi:hypothetical protein